MIEWIIKPSMLFYLKKYLLYEFCFEWALQMENAIILHEPFLNFLYTF